MGQLRVIVLDSSPTSRKVLEVILRREGHQSACFDGAPEALRFLAHAGPADLLFLSLKLHGMDGFEVLKYLCGEPRFHAMATIALLDARRHAGTFESPPGGRVAGGDEAAGAAAHRRLTRDISGSEHFQKYSPLRDRWASAPPRSTGSQRSFCSRGPASKQSFPTMLVSKS